MDDSRGTGIGGFNKGEVRGGERTAGRTAIEVDVGRRPTGRHVDDFVGDSDSIALTFRV